MGLRVAHSQRNGVAVQSAHDVSEFGLAARCQRKGFQPLLDLHGLYVRQTIRLPARQNPLPQITLVGVLRGIRFAVLVLGHIFRHLRFLVENVRHFVLSIVLNESLETDLLQLLPRSLFVDGQT